MLLYVVAHLVGGYALCRPRQEAAGVLPRMGREDGAAARQEERAEKYNNEEKKKAKQPFR